MGWVRVHRDCSPTNVEPWGGFLPIGTDWARLRPHLQPTSSFFLHAFGPRQQRIYLQCRRLGFDPWVGSPLQYSCLGIPWAAEPGGLYSPWGRNESDRTERVTLSLSGLGALRATGSEQTRARSLLPTVHIRPEGGRKLCWKGSKICTLSRRRSSGLAWKPGGLQPRASSG